MSTTTKAVIGMVQQDERVRVIWSTMREPALVGPRLLALMTPQAS